MTGVSATVARCRNGTEGPPKPSIILSYRPPPQSAFCVPSSPDFAETRLTPGAKKIVAALTENDWAGISQLKLSAAQTAELRRFLHGFLVFHLGQLPRGRATALAGPV